MATAIKSDHHDEPVGLPTPFFPRYPEKYGDVEPDPKFLPRDGNPYRTRATIPMVARALRGWLVPYIESRVMPGEFHPIVSYLFIEAYDNGVKGMTEEVARRSIDWLEDTRCRVLALMGGEVLLRPLFAHQVVDYAARKGFWVYVPTNGKLLRPNWIDRLGDAGVATINLAVDSVGERGPCFDYLIKKQYVYGFSVFLNITIALSNLQDVVELTEIAHDVGIATAYRLGGACSGLPCPPEDFPKVDTVIDWLIAKNRAGYKVVNSVHRLEEMKAFLRGKLEQWDCRAGQNSLIVRTDGTLAPCFPMYNAGHEWGTVGRPCFESEHLAFMKEQCQPHCVSTLNQNLSYCYQASRAIRWVLKQASHGFQGTTGSFED